MSYQAVHDAAQALYAAMFALEQELSSQSPDANVQRQALQLSVTRLTIQKLIGGYTPPETVRLELRELRAETRQVVVVDVLPVVPLTEVSAQLPSVTSLPSVETSVDKPASPPRRKPKGRR